MDEGINVLSLFDGMSCGRIALDRAGIKIKNYYACEIDKYAITVSKANYPDNVQQGSVADIHGWLLPKIDLLIGGSPCQGFSFAGRQLNFQDSRSKLFFEYARILEECQQVNPDIKFKLENVVMKKEYQKVISDILGVDPILINSSLVSAQNRKRLYWTNIEGVRQPEDRKIMIGSILESGDEKAYVWDKIKKEYQIREVAKSTCLDANYWKGIDNKHARTFVAGRLVGRRKNNYGLRCDSNKSYKVKQYFECNGNPFLSNCLTTVDKDNLIIYAEDGYYNYRFFTPLECERLQTVPEGYTAYVSNTQRKKMLGNGWTVDVVAHIFNYLDELY